MSDITRAGRLPALAPAHRASARMTAAVRRAGALAVVAAAGALLATACGGGARAAAPAGPSTYQQMAAYAECMQTHGSPTFPDPVSRPDGTAVFPPLPPAGPGLQEAQQACRKLQPRDDGQTTLAEQQTRLNELLKMAACLRTHGIPGQLDPVRTGNGYSLESPPGLDENSPQVQAAFAACERFLPGPGHGQG
jgi:hypothetical protein